MDLTNMFILKVNYERSTIVLKFNYDSLGGERSTTEISSQDHEVFIGSMLTGEGDGIDFPVQQSRPLGEKEKLPIQRNIVVKVVPEE